MTGSTPCHRVQHLIPRNTINVGVPESDMCLLSDNAVTPTPPGSVSDTLLVLTHDTDAFQLKKGLCLKYPDFPRTV